MKIAVLSGKGGTGKTTTAVNLAVNIDNAVLADCDVEEPNAHLFIKPIIGNSMSVTTSYPIIDKNKCTLCGTCGDFCRFNALLVSKKEVAVFTESCHDCGGCSLVCKNSAIKYKTRVSGKIKSGKGKVPLIYGELNVGEMSGVRIIKTMNKILDEMDKTIIIDAPPGTACAAVESVGSADYCIVVSEPTPFGVSDMKMVIEMLEEMNKPFGIVINKSDIGNSELYELCLEKNYEILGEIPFKREIAELYSRVEIYSLHMESEKEFFRNIYKRIVKND